jgi:hypothetical protein
VTGTARPVYVLHTNFCLKRNFRPMLPWDVIIIGTASAWTSVPGASIGRVSNRWILKMLSHQPLDLKSSKKCREHVAIVLLACCELQGPPPSSPWHNTETIHVAICVACNIQHQEPQHHMSATSKLNIRDIET